MKELPNKESGEPPEWKQSIDGSPGRPVYELPVFTWETIWEPAAKEGKHTEAQLSNWRILQFISEK